MAPVLYLWTLWEFRVTCNIIKRVSFLYYLYYFRSISRLWNCSPTRFTPPIWMLYPRTIWGIIIILPALFFLPVSIVDGAWQVDNIYTTFCWLPNLSLWDRYWHAKLNDCLKPCKMQQFLFHVKHHKFPQN